MITELWAHVSHPALGSVLLVLCAAAVWWVPGLAFGALLGLRGWLLAATAPAVTLGMTSVNAAVLPILGVPWRPVPAVLAFGCWLLVAWAARARFRPRPADSATTPGWSRAGNWAVAGGVVFAATIVVSVVLVGMHGISALPQIFDAPFHANAIRSIADSGDPRPAALGWLTNQSGNYYYPNTFHVLGALVRELTGQSVPAVMNANVLVLMAFALPLGVVALVRGLGGSSRLAAAAAAVSTAFTAFPYDLLFWGQLYPYVAAVTLVAGYVGLVVWWLPRATLSIGLLVAVAGAGMVAVHNSAPFVIAVFLLCFLVQRLFQAGWPALRRDLLWLASLGAATLVVALPSVLGAMSVAGEVSAFQWAKEMTPAQAFGEALFFGHREWWPQWLLAGLAIVGGYLSFKQPRWRWLIAAHSVFVVLFVVAASVPYPWAKLITSPWWNDRYRLMGVLPLVASIAVGWALQAAAQRLAAPAVRRWTSRPAVLWSAAAGAVLLVAYMVETGGYVERNAERFEFSYGEEFVSHAERDGLLALPSLVGPHDVVLNDVGDGTVWLYGLTGIRPAFSHYSGNMSADVRLLLDHLNQVDTDQAVRDAVQRQHTRFVVIGTSARLTIGRSPGMTGLDQVRSLHLVWANDGLRLYRVDLSPGPDV
ncbi:DUF6541 family protein [Actinocrispum wychmicini]|uniref:Dolichyl-phosphate-mannose-protein mannosyltransferase n=1 Tax=Actinocrispum wychmicini TaxID=1213861 RepID=A0A4R2J4L1_9PSEU|nr:DUF6541 family protein [Actinocrispum wychmicini]TCO53643.1 hypothetical protein EV192_110232 [Actinocrispum wychmicini]